MIGPSAGHPKRDHGAGTLASSVEFDAVAQLGVVHFGERLSYPDRVIYFFKERLVIR